MQDLVYSMLDLNGNSIITFTMTITTRLPSFLPTFNYNTSHHSTLFTWQPKLHYFLISFCDSKHPYHSGQAKDISGYKLSSHLQVFFSSVLYSWNTLGPSPLNELSGVRDLMSLLRVLKNPVKFCLNGLLSMLFHFHVIYLLFICHSLPEKVRSG